MRASCRDGAAGENQRLTQSVNRGMLDAKRLIPLPTSPRQRRRTLRISSTSTGERDAVWTSIAEAIEDPAARPKRRPDGFRQPGRAGAASSHDMNQA